MNGKYRQRGSTKNGPSGPSFFRGFFEHQFSVVRIHQEGMARNGGGFSSEEIVGLKQERVAGLDNNMHPSTPRMDNSSD